MVQAHVIFRHGARTPIGTPDYLPMVKYDDALMMHPPHTYVNYNLVDDETGTLDADVSQIRGRDSSFFGRLTASGSQQLHELGRELRNRYIGEQKLLTSSYNKDEVVVRSTKIQRTIESARCLLSGLFGETDKMFDIRVRNNKDEILIPNFHQHNHAGRPCCFINNVWNDTFSNTDLVDGVKEMRLEIEKLLEAPSKSGSLLPSYVRDNIMCHKFHQKMPKELQNSKLQQLAENATSKLMNFAFNRNPQHSRQMAQLSVGRLIRLLLDNMEEIKYGTNEEEKKKQTKMLLYSGHDTTLIPLLNILKLYNGSWPPFASHVAIELYRDEDIIHSMNPDSEEGFYVRVVYNSQEKKLPGCNGDSLCPLKHFKSAMEKFAIDESGYDAVCNTYCRKK